MKKYTFYVLDRSGRYHTCSFDNKDAYYDAFDKWEAGGHDVYTDRNQILRTMPAYVRMTQIRI